MDSTAEKDLNDCYEHLQQEEGDKSIQINEVSNENILQDVNKKENVQMDSEGFENSHDNVTEKNELQNKTEANILQNKNCNKRQEIVIENNKCLETEVENIEKDLTNVCNEIEKSNPAEDKSEIDKLNKICDDNVKKELNETHATSTCIETETENYKNDLTNVCNEIDKSNPAKDKSEIDKTDKICDDNVNKELDETQATSTFIETEAENNKNDLTHIFNEIDKSNTAENKSEIDKLNKICDDNVNKELDESQATSICLETVAKNNSNDLTNVCNEIDKSSPAEDETELFGMSKKYDGSSFEELKKKCDTSLRNNLDSIKNISDTMLWRTPPKEDSYTHRNQNNIREKIAEKNHSSITMKSNASQKEEENTKKEIIKKRHTSNQNKKQKNASSVDKEIRRKINERNVLYKLTEEELQAHYKQQRLGMDICDEEREILQQNISFQDGTKKDIFSVYKVMHGKETLSTIQNVFFLKNNKKVQRTNKGANKKKVQEEININMNKEIVQKDIVIEVADKQLVAEMLSNDKGKTQGETFNSKQKVQEICSISEENIQGEVLNSDREKIQDERKEQNNKSDDEKKTQGMLNVDVKKSLEIFSSGHKEKSAWWYICHICKKDTLKSFSDVQSHIKGRQHTHLASMVNSLSKERFAVRIVQGKYLKSGLIEENCTPTIERNINKCFKPLIGIEYVAEIIQIFNKSPVYHCLLCEFKGCCNEIMPHLQSIDHHNRYLAKFFPFFFKKIQKPSRVSEIQQIKHIIGRIQFVFGRLKPVQIRRVGNFDSWQKIALEFVESGKHFRERKLNSKYYSECHLPDHLPHAGCKDVWRLRLKLLSEGRFNPKKFIVTKKTSFGKGRKRGAEAAFQGNISQSKIFSKNNVASNWSELKRRKYEHNFTNTAGSSRNWQGSNATISSYDIPKISSSRKDTKMDLKRRQTLSTRSDESGIPLKISRYYENNSFWEQSVPMRKTPYTDKMYGSCNVSRRSSNFSNNRRNVSQQKDMTQELTRYRRDREEFREPWQQNLWTDFNETHTSISPRNKFAQYSGQQRDTSLERRRYENENLIYTLKKILTFDKYFTYLKPKVLYLLSQSLKKESFEDYEDALLSNIDNIILLETIKEKLTAYSENGMIDGKFAVVAEDAIQEITVLTSTGSKKMFGFEPRENDLFERNNLVEPFNQREVKELTSAGSRKMLSFEPRKHDLFERSNLGGPFNQREMTSYVSQEFFDYNTPQASGSNLNQNRYGIHHGRSTNISHSYSRFN